MESRRMVLGHREMIQQLLGQGEEPKRRRPIIKTTRKFTAIQSPDRKNLFKSSNFVSLQQEEKILRWAEMKIDSQLIHSCYPYCADSFTIKHFYNLNKKIQNLNEVCAVFKEVYDSQRREWKEELNQMIFIQEQLIKKYDCYQMKLEKLLQLQQRLKKVNIGKMNQRRQNKQLQKQSKKQIQSSQSRVVSNQQYPNIKTEFSSITKSVESKVKKQDAQKRQNQLETLLNKQVQVEKKRAQIQVMKKNIKHLQQTFQNIKQQIKESKQQNQSNQYKIQQNNQQLLQIQNQNQKIILELNTKQESYDQSKTVLTEQIFIFFLINFPLEFYRNEKIKLSNRLQQLRGNIRVYCRIRPIVKNQSPMSYHIQSHDLLKIKKKSQNQKSQNMKTDFEFVFDHIFDQSTTQESVFGQISQLIQTAINGSNVCIFAYGQTGSGKTFTMQGRKQNKQLSGVIPRSTTLIFEQLEKGKGNKTQFQIAVAVNEVYNDNIVNLLAKSNMKLTKPIFINVDSLKQVEDLLNKAVANRSTAFTLSNADSSRSHLIFVIRIKFKEQELGKQRESHLVLVDLAGSERVKESGVSKDRMKEAQHINSSLSQLGQVIRSLKSNKGKTNFRNSKLTYFLEPYLQKGSKAIMFVNISPASADESQTINSLKFASIARECRLQDNS